MIIIIVFKTQSFQKLMSKNINLFINIILITNFVNKWYVIWKTADYIMSPGFVFFGPSQFHFKPRKKKSEIVNPIVT